MALSHVRKKIRFTWKLATHSSWISRKTHLVNFCYEYRKVASSNMSRLEAHAGFFRLLMKEIFYPNVLGPLEKKS